MIALLSPAKNMDFSKPSNGVEFSMPVFLDKSAYLMGKLKKLSARQISKLMSINPDLSAINFDRNQRWNIDYLDNESKPAILAFNGEVYRGLDATSFNKEELNYAQNHILILSGLYGVLQALDKIQPYRLEMGSKLKITSNTKSLYVFWKNTITDFLNDKLESEKEKVLLNLASNEYFKAVDVKAIRGGVVDFQFMDWKNDSYKSVMTWAKLARGMMAREIVKQRPEKLEDVKEISFNNYTFNHKMSTVSNFVFTRDQH